MRMCISVKRGRARPLGVQRSEEQSDATPENWPRARTHFFIYLSRRRMGISAFDRPSPYVSIRLTDQMARNGKAPPREKATPKFSIIKKWKGADESERNASFRMAPIYFATERERETFSISQKHQIAILPKAKYMGPVWPRLLCFSTDKLVRRANQVLLIWLYLLKIGLGNLDGFSAVLVV